MKYISSSQNPTIKFVKQLETDNKIRKQHQLFVVEGIKEFNLAINSGYVPELVLINEKFADEIIKTLPKEIDEILVCEKAAFSKIAYREETESIVAVFKQKNFTTADIKMNENSLIIVLENVEKPGNLGAILRTADAVNADAVLVCNQQTDIYNPNVIRSGIGCFFSVKTILCSNEDCFNWLRKNGYGIYAALPDAKKGYHEISYPQKTSFVMGTESDGLSDFWKKDTINSISIPMLGKIDSLNVSVSTALLAYEYRRQTGF